MKDYYRDIEQEVSQELRAQFARDTEERPQWEDAGVELLYNTLLALRQAAEHCTVEQTKLLCWHCGIDYDKEIANAATGR
jgi:hypothetical protein